MLSERDRMSLHEIESVLRAEDDGFVRAFDILGRVADPVAPPPSRHRPPVTSGAPPLDRPLWRAVRLTLTLVGLVALLLFSSAVLTGVGGVAALMVVLGGTVGVLLFLTVSTARSRRC